MTNLSSGIHGIVTVKKRYALLTTTPILSTNGDKLKAELELPLGPLPPPWISSSSS